MHVPQPERRQVLKAGAVMWAVPVVSVVAAAPAYATSASDMSKSFGSATRITSKKQIETLLTIENSGSGSTTDLTVTITIPGGLDTQAKQPAPPRGWTLRSLSQASETLVFAATAQLTATTTLSPSPTFIIERTNNATGTVTIVIDPGGGGIRTTLVVDLT